MTAPGHIPRSITWEYFPLGGLNQETSMAQLNNAAIRLVLLASAASVALAACGGGSSTAVAPAPGTLRVALTDAPACGFDQVNVTVERVRVHRSSSANDNDSGWTDIAVNPARKIDLLSLTNGVIAELGQTTLAAGHYTQIRLLLSPNRGGSPANSVVLSSDGSETPIALDTPSATQSGIKLINGFTVTSNELTDLLLDFDACRSIVQRGNGSYGLKPVITVMPRIGAAIVGYVETGVAGVSVSAQKGGVVLRATQPNATGQFVLAPVDPTQAPYDIVFTAAGRITSVVTGVPATLNNTTVVSAVGSPVPMPDSDSGAVSGTVQPVQAAPTGRRSISLTCCGLALPRVAFIAWPTSALNAFSLPARNSSTDFGLAASTSSTIFSSAPASLIWRSPRAAMMRSARRARLGARPRSPGTPRGRSCPTPCRRRSARSAGQLRRRHRARSISSALAVELPPRVAHHPVGGGLACAATGSAATASK
jgi:hypothetical protein